MTDADALTLFPGDRICLRPSPARASPLARDTFTVMRIEQHHGDVRIVSVEGFRFIP